LLLSFLTCKLFCRLGKKKFEYSHSDSDTDTDDEEKNNDEESKSVIIDEGNSSSSSNKSEQDSSNNNNLSTISDSSSEGEIPSRDSLETISEEENNIGDTVESGVNIEAEMESKVEAKSLTNAEVAKAVVAVETANVEVNAEVADGEVSAEVANSNGICGLEEPLNFDNYNSPAEFEVHIIVQNF
jgi:hypothetical protein